MVLVHLLFGFGHPRVTHHPFRHIIEITGIAYFETVAFMAADALDDTLCVDGLSPSRLSQPLVLQLLHRVATVLVLAVVCAETAKIHLPVAPPLDVAPSHGNLGGQLLKVRGQPTLEPANVCSLELCHLTQPLVLIGLKMLVLLLIFMAPLCLQETL